LQDSIFDNYTIQSASSGNAINLEVPIQPLHSALKSALNASSASIRLTKKDNIPLLSLTIVTNSYTSGISTTTDDGLGGSFGDDASFAPHGRDRETIITQDVAVRVLSAESVEGIHEPRCREPDVHIMLPSLMQIKSISERYTKIAATTATNPSAGSGSSPKLELSGNMYGSLKISITTDALSISSVWTGLVNPELDAAQIEGGLSNHPSTRMKILGANGGDQGWAKVRIDGKDWLRVLAVGRLGGKFIACEWFQSCFRGARLMGQVLLMILP
jgi:HUS1 checkpoint protein